MKKICFITATRAEYGLFKWIMNEVCNSSYFDLQVIVTGAHLLQEQGYTIDQLVEDGFKVDEIVDVKQDLSSTESIAASMGRMAEGFARAFSVLKPDYVAVLGDRYELLPIVSTAFIMRIPIIHFCGGDVTEGAIDDGIRNAVTMMADYHFSGTQDSASNITRMRGTVRNLWNVGEPGLDSIFKEELLNRNELAASLLLNPQKRWCLFTYHAETKQNLEYNLNAVKVCFDCLSSIDDLQILATYSNADYGGRQINEYLEAKSLECGDRLRVIPSLGNQRYLSIMRQVNLVVGNSSSGIIESPMFGVPVVNVGNRQEGRHLCDNIIQTDSDFVSVGKAIHNALAMAKCPPDPYWGDGHAAERVIAIMERELG